jgi:hypothetical protein
MSDNARPLCLELADALQLAEKSFTLGRNSMHANHNSGGKLGLGWAEKRQPHRRPHESKGQGAHPMISFVTGPGAAHLRSPKLSIEFHGGTETLKKRF